MSLEEKRKDSNNWSVRCNMCLCWTEVFDYYSHNIIEQSPVGGTEDELSSESDVENSDAPHKSDSASKKRVSLS